MEDLDLQISQNINSLIVGKLSTGVGKLSLSKLKDYIKKNYNIVVDDNTISDIISNNSSVMSINGDVIELGTAQQKDEDNVEDNLLDKAKEQADNNLNQFESVADALTKLKAGDEISAKLIKLDENNLYYHLHRGASKANANYVVKEVLPVKLLNESSVKCEIKGTNLTLNIPIKCFVK